ncbi:hypothetical protein [Kribbella soli]|uniref:MmcQ/YjbR family DNA-binding protein n=1 Tax=Kribbella soli TaxID=1124743 RepID=A0A4V6N3L9_9ACTN|nr:hypothetical protein [Kribbella soli]TCC08366.1 hypothetical protein E0H45_20995 [Kribbella soli]
MATWRDVERIAGSLAGARPGRAHEGSPTVDIGRHPFARLRWDDAGREILQYWSLDLDSGDALADRRDVFFVVHTFKVKVSIWAWLDQLDEDELTEILTDSWLARRGVRT